MAKTKQKPPPDKPLRLEWIEAGSLEENPQNWRRHSGEQLSGLKELIDDPEIGWAGACLFNERTGRLIDGHGRKKVVDAKTPIPVLVGNWSEEAERKILLTLDPIASMATADAAQLGELLAETPLGGDLQSLADQLSDMSVFGEGGTKLKRLEVQRPPKTTWVLVGIPTVRYGEISELVEQIAAMPGTIVETTANDGEIP